MFEIELPRRASSAPYVVQRQRANRPIADKAAAALHTYFAFRSKQIDAPLSPSCAWFADALVRGRREFAGVLIDDRGDIAEDAQRPEVLKAYSRQLRG